MASSERGRSPQRRRRVVIGGDRLSGLDEGWFFEPTIFGVTDQSCAIAPEEVFGPVLTIVPFRDEREAVRLENSFIYDFGRRLDEGH